MNQPAFGEARKTQQRCVDQVRLAGENQVAENLSRGRGVHHAVSAETVGQEKAWHSGSFAQNWMVVRRHLIQAGPRTLGIHRQIREAGHAVGRAGQDFFDEGGIEIRFEAGRFFGIVPGQQKSAGFGAKVKSVRHVDDHGRGVGKFVKGLAGDQHAAQRLDRQIARRRAWPRSRPTRRRSSRPWRVDTEPRVVSTDAIPVASRVKPVTLVFFHNVAPCSAAQVMNPIMAL